MDPVTNQQPISSQPVQPAIQPASHSSFPKILLIFFGIIFMLGLAGGAYFLGTQQARPMKLSQVANIVHFPLSQPTPTPTNVPTATPTPDPTAGWLIYTNTKYNYSIKYPQGLTPNEQNTYYHYVEFKSTNATGQLPAYIVSAIPDSFIAKDPAAYNYMSSDWIANLYQVPVGTTKTLDSAATFIRLPDMIVGGKSAIEIDITATGYKQRRIYVKNNGNIYMISNYYQPGDQLTDFQYFLSSFKFTQ